MVSKWEQEIKMLRYQYNEKVMDINNLKVKHKSEIEVIKQSYTQSGFHEAEKMFKEKEIILFQKFDAEKVELFKQLRDSEQISLRFNEILKERTLKSAVS